MKNNQNGITLIALVVTIIVLLILAGVSIAMLTGQNGILKNAQEARNQSAAGTLDEAAKIAVGNILTNNLKWPYGTSTTAGDTTTITLTDDEVSDAQTEIVKEIQTVNSNITGFTWGSDPTSGYKYALTANVDGKSQTINIDLSTGAVTK